MDKISGLPDGVISHILSFLPIKKAARTSVLSKRWRILFAFTPNLELLDCEEEDNGQSFMDFVDRVLAVSGNSPIKKLSLRCRNCFDTAHINRWIIDVLTRGVLDLNLATYDEDVFSLPLEIFTCKTLVKLKLTGFSINVLPEDAFLPALKTLSLKMLFYCRHVCAFEKLLSACPVLEDLAIYDLNWERWKCSRTISSPTLGRLTLNRSDFECFDVSDSWSITFDTPKLTYLYYSDFIPDSYPVVSLDSLVEANLDLIVTVDHDCYSWYDDEGDNVTSNPTNLINGLRDVEIMNLLAHGSLEMFYCSREAIPMFENLSHLSLTVSWGCWRGLPFLLNKSPNLETLIIKGTVHYDGYRRDSSLCYCLSEYSFLLSCPVKVLEITQYNGTKAELEHMKHFLEKLSCLELVKVKIQGTNDRKFQTAKDLLMLPRASSKCKIQIM